MTEELNFKAICNLASNILQISEDALSSKTRKKPIQIARACVAYIAMKEEDISRNVIAHVLNRNRATTYHYETNHKKDYFTSRIYRNTFNKIYKAYKDIDGAKNIFIDADYMKSFLLKNGVKEKLQFDVSLKVKSGQVYCIIKTSYFDFSNQIENISLALKNYHYTINII
jgi:hypothetical protein